MTVVYFQYNNDFEPHCLDCSPGSIVCYPCDIGLLGGLNELGLWNCDKRTVTCILWFNHEKPGTTMERLGENMNKQ